MNLSQPLASINKEHLPLSVGKNELLGHNRDLPEFQERSGLDPSNYAKQPLVGDKELLEITFIHRPILFARIGSYGVYNLIAAFHETIKPPVASNESKLIANPLAIVTSFENAFLNFVNVVTAVDCNPSSVLTYVDVVAFHRPLYLPVFSSARLGHLASAFRKDCSIPISYKVTSLAKAPGYDRKITRATIPQGYEAGFIHYLDCVLKPFGEFVVDPPKFLDDGVTPNVDGFRSWKEFVYNHYPDCRNLSSIQKRKIKLFFKYNKFIPAVLIKCQFATFNGGVHRSMHASLGVPLAFKFEFLTHLDNVFDLNMEGSSSRRSLKKSLRTVVLDDKDSEN